MLAENRFANLFVESLQTKLAIFLLLCSLFFSDWKIPVGNISFSDLFSVCIVIILLSKVKNLTKIQVFIIIGLIMFVFLNFLGQYLLNPYMVFAHYYIYVMKVSVYSVALCLIYNVIKKNAMEKILFKYLILFTLIWVIVAILIYCIQLLKVGIPYKFLWYFTRSDEASYVFRGSSLIRMRGLNSEPSYFGGVLALVLSINYFNSFKFRIGIVYESVLLACSLLSFSFSVVPIIMMLKLFDLINRYGLSFLKKKWFIYAAVVLLAMFLLIFDKISVAFIGRFYDIVSGKDTSASSRLLGSWGYINNIFLGNGVGNTPAIWNNYAYVFSDFGLVPFLLSILFSLRLCSRNIYFGLFFIIVSFQKGGYLSFYYWILIFLLIIFSSRIEAEM